MSCPTSLPSAISMELALAEYEDELAHCNRYVLRGYSRGTHGVLTEYEDELAHCKP
jgi:hypothetical protein